MQAYMHMGDWLAEVLLDKACLSCTEIVSYFFALVGHVCLHCLDI